MLRSVAEFEYLQYLVGNEAVTKAPFFFPLCFYSLQEAVLKAFIETVEGIVNFELTMDAMNKAQNRGFGFATFETVEACKAAHEKYYKDKLKIMVSYVLTREACPYAEGKS